MSKTAINVDQADTEVIAPMVDLFSEFAVNETAAKEGTWVDFRGGVKFLIARDGNTTHRRELLKYWKDNPTDGTEEAKTEEAQEKRSKLIRKAAVYGAARGILLGWTGPVAYGGKPMPYSVENAEKLLAMSDFLDWVSTQSNERSNFAAKIEDAETKN